MVRNISKHSTALTYKLNHTFVTTTCKLQTVINNHTCNVIHAVATELLSEYALDV